MEKAAKCISQISLEVDRLAGQVYIWFFLFNSKYHFLFCFSVFGVESDQWLVGFGIDKVGALESIISKGKKVAESDVISLIEQLMNELLKLDAIMADGDVKLQRKMQVIFFISFLNYWTVHCQVNSARKSAKFWVIVWFCWFFTFCFNWLGVFIIPCRPFTS